MKFGNLQIGQKFTITSGPLTTGMTFKKTATGFYAPAKDLADEYPMVHDQPVIPLPPDSTSATISTPDS
jgi:hypothetical protein